MKEAIKYVLESADIICCTLNSSGAEFLRGRLNIDSLVIDEASQCIELESLIPF